MQQSVIETARQAQSAEALERAVILMRAMPVGVLAPLKVPPLAAERGVLLGNDLGVAVARTSASASSISARSFFCSIDTCRALLRSLHAAQDETRLAE